MDNTLLFAYCITDGELDNFTEQQKKSILHVINNIKDAMLLEKDHRKMRPNNSLLDMTARTNRFK